MNTLPQPRSTSPLPGPRALPIIVLDTNVVLDWLVFRDPSCGELGAQLRRRRLSWWATTPMRDELASVLARPQLLAWRPDCERVLSLFDMYALPCTAEPRAGASEIPRCRDPDDQKFIDLACVVGARWLLTRDRALLDLARAARLRDVEILRPVDWNRRRDDVHRVPAPI